ncbi:sirohydrochlorin chelatase [Streptomyces sp. NPDC092296]|uniref:sirohydrochlorin chelatase n=1 Tax=Streptomyces sp. NPDC092296 TaxID=3366012 RepID=UPI003818315A
MSSAATPGTPLPVRTPGSPARGRHRRPERPEIPADAPALLLAVPATADPETQSLTDEIVSIVRGEQPGIDVTAAYLPTADGDPGQATVAALLAQAAEAGAPTPIVVPLLPGPHPAALADLWAAAEATGAVVTDVLGPHPLLAEAVHVRLSEADLARADRARLFTINTTADGVVLAAAGGEEAVQAAGITGVLLAARLAVPVVPAALDVPGSVQAAVAHLRATGAARPALAPFVIGPEVEAGLLASVTEEAGCPAAEPLGAYPAIGRLIVSAYLAALGVAEEQPGRPVPAV